MDDEKIKLIISELNWVRDNAKKNNLSPEEFVLFLLGYAFDTTKKYCDDKEIAKYFLNKTIEQLMQLTFEE